MGPEVYKESLTILFSAGSQLLLNYGKLFELELSEDCDAFLYFGFWPVILNEYEK